MHFIRLNCDNLTGPKVLKTILVRTREDVPAGDFVEIAVFEHIPA